MSDWYVSTTGQSTNPGTLAEPWDLYSALLQKYLIVQPGDTIWIAAGTYVHPDRSQNAKGYQVRLYGTYNQPIKVRPYPDQLTARVILDGGVSAYSVSESAYPRYVWLMYLELIVQEMIDSVCLNHGTPRTTDWATSTEYVGPDQNFPWGGFDFPGGVGLKFIHLISHGNGQGSGVWSKCTDGTEIYGCLIYDNGYMAPDRWHGHSTYEQNTGLDGTWRYIENNMMFGGYGPSVIAAYGSETAESRRFDMRRNLIWWGADVPAPEYFKEPYRTPSGRQCVIGSQNPNSNLYYEFHDNLAVVHAIGFGYTAAGNHWRVKRNKLAFSHIKFTECPDLECPPYLYHRPPVSDEVSPSWQNWSGSYTSIDDNPDYGTACDADYVQNVGADAESTAQYGLIDMPSDFVSMSALNYTIRANNFGAGDDSTNLYVQIVKSDGSTALTNEMLVATLNSASAWKTYGAAFTGVQSATKADWDGARIKFRTTYNRVDTHDAQVCRISAVEVFGFYVGSSAADYNFQWRESGYTLGGYGYLEPHPIGYPLIQHPTVPVYLFNPSKYDSNRAHFGGFAFQSQTTCTVDVSTWANDGDPWEARDPADFWGSPVASGTVQNGTIVLPLTYDMPEWMDQPGFTFAAWVLLKGGAAPPSEIGEQVGVPSAALDGIPSLQLGIPGACLCGSIEFSVEIVEESPFVEESLSAVSAATEASISEESPFVEELIDARSPVVTRQLGTPGAMIDATKTGQLGIPGACVTDAVRLNAMITEESPFVEEAIQGEFWFDASLDEVSPFVEETLSLTHSGISEFQRGAPSCVIDGRMSAVHLGIPGAMWSTRDALAGSVAIANSMIIQASAFVVHQPEALINVLYSLGCSATRRHQSAASIVFTVSLAAQVEEADVVHLWPVAFRATKAAYDRVYFIWDWKKWLSRRHDAITWAEFAVPDGLNIIRQITSDKAAAILLGGGVSGQRYIVNCRIQTSASRTKQSSMILTITE